MKKITVIAAILPLLSFCSCGEGADLSETQSGTAYTIQSTEAMTYYEQNISQFREGSPERTVLSYEYQIGEWLPYMRYDEMMRNKSAEEFRSAVRERFKAAKADSVNTVYVHVHPNGDAYYRSDIFPKGPSWTGDYDPLEIMISEAHSLGLSIHAWLNPLRCQTEEAMSALPESFIIKQWTLQPEGSPAVNVGGRWYLDPSRPETLELLRACIREIAARYEVDGFHIDDYFYPTADASFDSEQFAASGADDLAEWRLSNCTSLVKAMHDVVKEADERLEFGISPQGSISGNYSSQFADVKLWAAEKGFCDYIVPQIYFGFDNESCPFEETLAEWVDMTKSGNVRLVVGLAEYKLGKPDKWAGIAGENEWVDSPDIIERQIKAVKSSGTNGYALYK